MLTPEVFPVMLSGPKIRDLVRAGALVMDPLPPDDAWNPNSVNLRLGHQLRVYTAQIEYHRWLDRWHANNPRPRARMVEEGVTYYGSHVPPEAVLDPYGVNDTLALAIPDGPDGIVLVPGLTYLGHTVEAAGSAGGYAPVLEGRSTWGRLGLQSHQTAGFGDVGFRRQWTLEIQVTTPVRLRRGDPICQIAFHAVDGPEQLYGGRYAEQTGATPAAPLPPSPAA